MENENIMSHIRRKLKEKGINIDWEDVTEIEIIPSDNEMLIWFDKQGKYKIIDIEEV